MNYYIDFYWKLPDWELKSQKPPKEFCGIGNKIEQLASDKAWQIVKSVRKNKSKRKSKPVFKKDELEFTDSLFSFCDFTTKEFDVWIKCYSDISHKRILIPLKKHRRLNYWLNKGAVFSKAIKFKKIKKNWYVIVYLNYQPPKRQENQLVIGFDVDYTNGVVDSTGRIWFGKEWEDLRKRTKWRSYKNGVNPLKQLLNRVAKEVVNTYQCNYAFEKLEFKGKKGRSRKFRRAYKNLPYNHLPKRVKTLAYLEGSQNVNVSPQYLSQTCPVCLYRDKKNRQGDWFKCRKCGFAYHVDVVGAVNVSLRAGLRYGFQPVVVQAVAEEWRRQAIQPPLECLVVCTPSQSRQGVDVCTLKYLLGSMSMKGGTVGNEPCVCGC